MTRSVVELYNLACSSVGAKARISSPTENSREADTCSLWYGVVRETVLQAAPWPSTGKYRRLGLLATRSSSSNDWTVDQPSPNWTYAYSLPNDCVRPRWMTNYARFRIDWLTVTGEDPVKAIMTDQEDAILHYTFDQTNVAEWDSSLYLAVASALAGFIAMPLTGKLNLAKLAITRANELINEARLVAGNQISDTYDSVPEWIEARGYGDSGQRIKYFYPNGNALSVSALPVSGPGQVST